MIMKTMSMMIIMSMMKKFNNLFVSEYYKDPDATEEIPTEAEASTEEAPVEETSADETSFEE